MLSLLAPGRLWQAGAGGPGALVSQLASLQYAISDMACLLMQRSIDDTFHFEVTTRPLRLLIAATVAALLSV